MDVLAVRRGRAGAPRDGISLLPRRVIFLVIAHPVDFHLAGERGGLAFFLVIDLVAVAAEGEVHDDEERVAEGIVAVFPVALGKVSSSLPVSAAQKKVNRIISYIQEHIREDIHISDLAEHFSLNADYLSRLFKAHAHISLGRYLTLQKVIKAQDLLREGQSVAAVSDKLGYSSYAYFFRTFQKITGISPSRYRSLYKAQ